MTQEEFEIVVRLLGILLSCSKKAIGMLPKSMVPVEIKKGLEEADGLMLKLKTR